jgi:hypothetical protein
VLTLDVVTDAARLGATEHVKARMLPSNWAKLSPNGRRAWRAAYTTDFLYGDRAAAAQFASEFGAHVRPAPCAPNLWRVQ